MTAIDRASPEPEVLDASAVQAADVANLRKQLAETQRRLAEELRRNDGLYRDRAADRAAMGAKHEDLHGANVQLLKDRQALEESNLRLELRVAELERKLSAALADAVDAKRRPRVTFGDVEVAHELVRIADAIERIAPPNRARTSFTHPTTGDTAEIRVGEPEWVLDVDKGLGNGRTVTRHPTLLGAISAALDQGFIGVTAAE